MRSERLLAVACVVVATLISGCGGSDARAEYDEATTALDRTITAYLGLDQRPDPASADDWASFLNDGDRLTRQLRSDYDAWSGSLDAVIAAGQLPASEPEHLVREYQRTLGTWVTAMEEQLSLTRPCYPPEGGPPHAECFMQVMADHGPRWARAGEAVSAVIGDLAQVRR